MQVINMVKNFKLQYRDMISGVIVSIILFFPFAGKLFNFIPGRIVSLVFLFFLILMEMKAFSTPKKIDLLFLKKHSFFIIMLVFCFFILLAGTSTQYSHLFDFKLFINNWDDYVSTKLSKTVLSIIPSMLCVYYMYSMEKIESIRNFCIGLIIGFFICYVEVVLKVSFYLTVILDSDYETSRSFYMNRSKPFSIVGIAPICCAASCIFFYYFFDMYNKSKITFQTICLFVVAVFSVFCLFIVRQRADFILCISLITFLLTCNLNKKNFLRFFLASVFVLLSVFFLCYFFINSFQVSYWTNLFDLQNCNGFNERFEGYKSCISGLSSFSQIDAILFGNKIGSFSFIQPILVYPHNIPLEILYESGLIAFLIFLFSMLSSTFYAFRIIAKSNDSIFICCSLVFLSFIFHNLKAHDVTTVGTLVFLICLIDLLRKIESKESFLLPTFQFKGR